MQEAMHGRMIDVISTRSIILKKFKTSSATSSCTVVRQ
jgi:hypothetical protein